MVIGSVDLNFKAFPSNLNASSAEHLNFTALPVTTLSCSSRPILLELKKPAKETFLVYCTGTFETNGKIGVNPILD
jgi:hypothetical protein